MRQELEDTNVLFAAMVAPCRLVSRAIPDEQQEANDTAAWRSPSTTERKIVIPDNASKSGMKTAVENQGASSLQNMVKTSVAGGQQQPKIQYGQRK
jgi:hypothetical protein